MFIKRKKLILSLISLTLILILGGGSYYYFYKPVIAKLSEEEKEILLKEESERRKEELQLFLEYPYFRLPSFRIPVIRNGYVHAYLHLRLEMKAKNREGFELVKVLLPRLSDAIFTDLYKALSTLWIESSNPNPEVIRERAFVIAQSIVGENKIEEVYIRQIMFMEEN